MESSSLPLLNEQFDFNLFLFIAKKNLIFIALFFLIVILSGYLYVRYESEIFDSSSTIQIVTNNEANQILNINGTNAESMLSGDVELIRSKVFLNRALSKLPLEVSYFYQGTFKVNEHYKTSPYQIEYKVKNEGVYNIPIFINFINPNEYILTYKLGAIKVSKKFKPNSWADFGDFFLYVHLTDPEAAIEGSSGEAENSSYFFKINDKNNLADQYLSKIDVIILSISAGTIQISYQDNSPQKAADIVNILAEEFKEYDVEKKSQSSKKVLEFIDIQLSKSYETVKEYEGQIQNLKRELKSSTIPDYTSIFIEKTNECERKLVDLKLQKAILKEVNDGIKKDKLDFDNLNWILVGSRFSDNLSGTLSNLNSIITNYENYKIDNAPTNFNLLKLEKNLEEKKGIFSKQINYYLSKLNSEESVIEQTILEIENKFNELPEIEFEYNKINRFYSVNTNFYNLLLTKKAEYSINIAGYVSNNEILEHANPSKSPIYPNKNIVMIINYIYVK